MSHPIIPNDAIGAKPDIMPQIKESFDATNDINDEKEEISVQSTSNMASKTLNSISTDIRDNDAISIIDNILPQFEPTKPEMRAPRPMIKNFISRKVSNRRHSYNYGLSRTDLQIDASGDETTS